MRKSLLLVAAAAVLTLGAGPALAKKQLVIVVKGLDNPFFEAIHQGCEKWNKENASSPYHCFYTGPASTSDEAGEAQHDRSGPPAAGPRFWYAGRGSPLTRIEGPSASKRPVNGTAEI